MNLRISEDQLRFRITNEELNELLHGATLNVVVPLPKQSLQYSIRAEELGYPLAIEKNEAGLVLLVNRQELELFSYKEEIKHIVKLGKKDLNLVLEVDFRSLSKKNK